MRILVCGGRSYGDYTKLADTLWRIEEKRGKITQIIHGAATGADSLADQFAAYCKIPCSPFPADWIKHGRHAGPIRNQLMIDEGHPDLVVAFPGGKGTADMIKRAKAAHIETIIV